MSYKAPELLVGCWGRGGVSVVQPQVANGPGRRLMTLAAKVTRLQGVLKTSRLNASYLFLFTESLTGIFLTHLLTSRDKFYNLFEPLVSLMSLSSLFNLGYTFIQHFKCLLTVSKPMDHVNMMP